MPGWKRILCAIDFSEQARHALLEAAEQARRSDADLELLHVHAPPVTDGEVFPPQDDVPETGLVELERTVATWRTEAEALARKPVRAAVLPGDAAVEIARMAAEHRVDLVVLGTHGRKGLARLVLGSVAERVVREAPCDVLVVRRR